MYKYLILFLFFLWQTTLANEQKLNIVTSFSIMEDITKNIVLNKANVTTIVPKNSDSHGYSITPNDLINIEKSDLFIVNGLGFEGFLARLENSKLNDKIIIASKSIKPIVDNNHEHDGHHHNNSDPHIWQDPLMVITMVNNITTSLCAKDAVNCVFYQNNAQNYTKKLQELNDKYALIFNNIPKEQRVIITTHKAFNYLAYRYNIKIFAPFNIDSHAEPSAKDLAKLSDLITSAKIKAIFTENITNNTIIKEIAKQHNLNISGVLYSDSLANEDASTYLELIEHNLEVISQSMK